MSIATKRGDGGETGLAGGIRVSKGCLRVETYGTVDELNSILGVARSHCSDTDLQDRTKSIQQELFRVGSSLATPPESKKAQVVISAETVDRLTMQVEELESIAGLLSDWSLPGEHPEGAFYDQARTVCRRAERCAVRLVEAGDSINPNVIPYLNRLSDLLWLFARKLEVQAGVTNSLREMNGKSGPRWSRAW